MALVYLLSLIVLGVTCQHQHHHHDSDAIYHKMINDMWLTSDANDDGVFDRYELALAFAHYDENGDQNVTHHEHVDSIPKHSELHEFTSAVFKIFDANDDGVLDTPDIDILYKKFDEDDDAEVTKAEFTKYWMKVLTSTAHLHGHGLHLGHN